jgi:polysaccharide biosynthesis protein PslG
MKHTPSGASLVLIAMVAAAALTAAGCEGLGSLRDPGELRNRTLALVTPLLAPALDTADLAPVSETWASGYGVNTFLEQEVDEAKLRRTLQLARDAGFTWIRQEFPWRDVEQSAKGDYWDHKWNQDAWAKYDRIVTLAQEYGLTIVARLDAPPDWSRLDNSLFYRPPDNYDDFGDYVAAVVSRYQGKVQYFQIWNEPNIYPEWGNQPVRADEYTRLLQIAYRRAKQANPACIVIAAALAPTIAHEPMNRSDVLYLQEMYDAGARGSFDILSTMAYGLLSGADDRRADPWRDVNFSRPMLLRQVMVRNGDAAKSIWISELGWNVLPPGFPEEPRYGRVNDEQQARYTVRGLQRIRQEWPWVGVVNIWYLRQPGNWQPSQQEYYFRMLDPDFTAHPVYDAVAAFIRGATTLERGYRQDNASGLIYTGGWTTQTDPRSSAGSYHLALAAGAAISFSFSGTDLDLVTRKGPDAGAFLVSIDEMPASDQQLPRDAGGLALADLYSPQETWQAVVPLAHGLTAGPHQVSLTPAGRGSAFSTGSDVIIDAFIVDRRSGFPMPLIFGAAVFTGLWAVAWRRR